MGGKTRWQKPMMTWKLLVMFTFAPCKVDTGHLYGVTLAYGVIVPFGKGELKHKLEVGGLNLHSYVAPNHRHRQDGTGLLPLHRVDCCEDSQVPFKRKPERRLLPMFTASARQGERGFTCLPL